MISSTKYHLLSALLILLFALGILSACGGNTPTPSSDTLATAVAQSVAATLAASQPKADAAITTVAATAAPTNTPQSSPTPAPTDTPAPTATRRPSVTPAPTSTLRPTNTPTPRPGLGTDVRCGNDWTVKVVRAPSFAKQLNVLDTGGYLTFSSKEPAKGTWLMLLFELTNLQSKTDSLSMFGDDLLIEATLNGSSVSFSPSSWGTSSAQRSAGISNWSDDVPPGITATMLAIFDVNPAATDWKLVIKTDSCETKVYLIEEQGVATGATASIGNSAVNLRGGPGTSYPIVGKAAANQGYQIVGRNRDSSWWQICCVNGQKAWVAASVANALGPTADVPVPENIPTPPPVPTAAPRPTAIPLSKESSIGKEYLTTLWGLKLYDVKRAKAVYFYGTAEIANGTWLIPLVEFRNLGTGTNQPNSNLHFYLQDEAGRRFDYDVWTDGDLGASWQFKAGHLYDRINPGSVLGIAIAFDVAPDLGDMWLRVKEAPNVIMYLGNVSQMAESK